MSGKKEHKKGGKQYQQERKRKYQSEDSVGRSEIKKEMKERRKRKNFKKVDDRPAPVTESNNSENNSDELPDVKL